MRTIAVDGVNPERAMAFRSKSGDGSPHSKENFQRIFATGVFEGVCGSFERIGCGQQWCDRDCALAKQFNGMSERAAAGAEECDFIDHEWCHVQRLICGDGCLENYRTAVFRKIPCSPCRAGGPFRKSRP